MMNTEPTGLTTSSNSPNLSLAGVSQLNSTLTRPNTEAIGTNEVKTNIEAGRNLNSPDSSTNSREEEEFNSDRGIYRKCNNRYRYYSRSDNLGWLPP